MGIADKLTLKEFTQIMSELPKPENYLKKFNHNHIEVLIFPEGELVGLYDPNLIPSASTMCVNPKKVVFKIVKLSTGLKWELV